MFREISSLVNKVLRSAGYEIRVYDHGNTAFQARAALRDKRLDTIIDAGANTGQYGLEVRRTRADIPIYSFEPLPDAFSKLRAVSEKVDNWKAFNVALGRESTVLPITVAANSQSSSLFKMEDLHLRAAPESAAVEKIMVPVEPLDSFLNHFGKDLFIKVDTQGFESEVLAGGPIALSRARYVQLEVSFAPLYEGAPAPHEIVKQMYDQGFEIHTITSVFSDPARARLLQADILFSRPS